MSSGSDKYICSLDADTQRKAKDELYEDPINRQGAIDKFREWILQQKHITCPVDNVFLLGFLRAKHCSQLEARQGLESYLKWRMTLKKYLLNLDPEEKAILDLIDRGTVLTMPGRDKEGRKCRLFIIDAIDWGDKGLKLAFFRTLAVTMYYDFFCDEATQVHGVAHLYDLTDFSMAKNMKIKMDERKEWSYMIQKTFPARVKGMHMYNGGAVIDFLMNLFKILLSDKLQKRLHVHSGLESTYKYFPKSMMPEEYLPDDYTGPRAGTLAQFKEMTKKELCRPEIRERIKDLSSDRYFIKMTEKDTEVAAASFRQLNVE